MAMTNQRYISPGADRYIQRSQSRLVRLKKQRDKQRRKEMTNGIIFIMIGVAFAVGLVYLIASTGNLNMTASNGISGSFERLLNR